MLQHPSPVRTTPLAPSHGCLLFVVLYAASLYLMMLCPPRSVIVALSPFGYLLFVARARLRVEYLLLFPSP